MTEQEKRSCYEAFKARDVRFDGHFFVGVSSTGIYCRPVCRANLPKYENCAFFPSAAAAEQAGFRPCLLCRPELAPGTSVAPVDATQAIAVRAAKLLEERGYDGRNLEELATRLGCSSRHLRRAFAAQYGVTPVKYLQSCRLLLAKNLLTSTRLPVISVATASGFGSLRRFNDLFKRQYRLAPGALRRAVAVRQEPGSDITLELGYRPPYQWRRILDFFAFRAVPGVEVVREERYWRTVSLQTEDRRRIQGWLRVENRPEKNVLAVTAGLALLPVLPAVLARIRRQFDLYCNPDIVYEGLASMNEIRPGLCVPGVRLPGCFDPFEMAVRAILGQQITVKAARTLAERLVGAYGIPLKTGVEGLTHIFPSPEAVLALDVPVENRLGPLGISGARSRSIRELAGFFSGRRPDLALPPEELIEKLLAIPGVGAWTAQYIAMRAFGWPDAFPHTDYGVKKALAPRTEKGVLALAETWRPWRGYATVNLWNFLQNQN